MMFATACAFPNPFSSLKAAHQSLYALNFDRKAELFLKTDELRHGSSTEFVAKRRM